VFTAPVSRVCEFFWSQIGNLCLYGKVVPVHTVQAQSGSFIPWLLITWEKSPTHSIQRLGQPQTLSGYFGEKQNLALLGIKPQFF
jgi:hypothetical protein